MQGGRRRGEGEGSTGQNAISDRQDVRQGRYGVM